MNDLGSSLHDVVEASITPLDIDAIVERRRRQRRQRRVGSVLAAAAVVVVVLSFSTWAFNSNGSTPVTAVHVSPSTSAKPVDPTKAGPQRYEIDARVEEDRTHGPELCIYVTAGAALPGASDCGGPRITNWDWAQAPNPQRAGGTTSGVYHLVGTYNGETYALTQRPIPGHEPRPAVKRDPAPCPTPEGGWRATDTAHIGLGDFQALEAAAQGAPDFAGLWMSSTTASAPVNDFQHSQVTVVAYTGNVAVHRAELAALWGGPTCVVQRPHSYAQLQAATTRLVDEEKQLGLQIQSVGPDEVENAVRLEVIAATDATQRAIDQRFGPGLVKVSSLMKPIS